MNNEGIEYRQWGLPAPKAVFLLVHGLGAHAGRWEAMGDFFLKKSILSYAIELPQRDLFRNCYNDIIGLYGIAAKNNPAKPIFLAGESMGAVISFLLAAGSPGLFRGLICISPAFANRYRPALLDVIKIFAPLLYNPNKQFKLPFDSSMCTRDIDYRKRMDRDPREYRTISSKLIFEILLAQARAGRIKEKMTTPALFLLAGEDKIVDPKAAGAIFNGLLVEDKTLIEFPEMYHSLSIELGKESVFEEISRWVDKRIA